MQRHGNRYRPPVVRRAGLPSVRCDDCGRAPPGFDARSLRTVRGRHVCIPCAAVEQGTLLRIIADYDTSPLADWAPVELARIRAALAG